jgi:general secretion pathway protein H
MSLDRRGYTLVELIVVVLLIGLVLSFTAPRLRDSLLTDHLKGAARRIMGVVSNLRNEAVRECRDYTLHFDLDSGRFWITHGSMTRDELALAVERGSGLPSGVRIRDIWIKGKGNADEGEVRISFTRRGYTRQSAIHLSAEDGREITLILSPFLDRVKAVDRYVGFD